MCCAGTAEIPSEQLRNFMRTACRVRDAASQALSKTRHTKVEFPHTHTLQSVVIVQKHTHQNGLTYKSFSQAGNFLGGVPHLIICNPCMS